MEIKKERDSFVFYRSFKRSIDALPENLQIHLYKAITEYGLELTEPSFDDIESGFALNAVWMSIKPQLDANYRKFLNGNKGREYGILGGAPMGNQNARKHPIQNNPKTTPNVNYNVNINDNVDEYVNDIFTPPTLQDVSSYISSIGSAVNPEKFYNYYSAIGWKDKNGNQIKNWKAVIYLWQEHENTKKKVSVGKSAAKMYD